MKVEVDFVEIKGLPEELENMDRDRQPDYGDVHLRLETFIKHLRDGHFGNEVMVTFDLGNPFELRHCINYHVVMNNAPNQILVLG